MGLELGRISDALTHEKTLTLYKKRGKCAYKPLQLRITL
jgi:hypothetical protein